MGEMVFGSETTKGQNDQGGNILGMKCLVTSMTSRGCCEIKCQISG